MAVVFAWRQVAVGEGLNQVSHAEPEQPWLKKTPWRGRTGPGRMSVWGRLPIEPECGPVLAKAGLPAQGRGKTISRAAIGSRQAGGHA